MKTPQLAMIDDEAIITTTQDVSYEHYLRHIIELDKNTYNKILGDLNLRSQFEAASVETRFKFFKPEFQNEVKQLYSHHQIYKKSCHALAISIYNISTMTGSTYEDIAKVLEKAFQRQVSKSHISKLFNAGRLLNHTPQLNVVHDVEKLASLSRIPEATLAKITVTGDDGVIRVDDEDIGKASRSTVSKIVEKQVVRPKKSPPPYNFNSLLNHLENANTEALVSGRTELSEALVNCIKLIKEI